MARLRLFGPARDAAGTGLVEISASVVDDVLSMAVERYGDQFAVVLASSRIWLNGAEVGRDHPVGPADEVAVLPPVSGG